MKDLRVAIEQLRIRGYRSCLTSSFKLNPELTVLVGPNGSGKTNVLHALLLLRSLGGRRIRRATRDSRPSRCFLQATFKVGTKLIPYRAWISYVTNDRNLDEVVFIREQWNFRDIQKLDSWEEIPSGLFDDPYVVFTSQGKQVVRSVHMRLPPGYRPVESMRIVGPHRNSLVSKRVGEFLQAIAAYRSRITYYSASQFTNPGRCPSSFEIDEDGDLRETGVGRFDHLRFVFDLFKTSKADERLYAQYMSIVGKQGIGLIDRITWRQVKVSSSSVEVTSGGKVVKEKRERLLIIPNVHIRRSHLSFNQLSEGTFKTLALLYYLISDKSGLLLIEEPEVCVHYGLLSSVIEIVKSFSKDRQILCSTHSDYVLDCLDESQVLTVTNQGARGTEVRSMSQALSRRTFEALKTYLRTEGNLGEFWKHGGLE